MLHAGTLGDRCPRLIGGPSDLGGPHSTTRWGGHCYHFQARSYLLFPQSLLVLGGGGSRCNLGSSVLLPVASCGLAHSTGRLTMRSHITYMRCVLLCLSLLPCAAYCWAPGPSAVLVHEGGPVSLSREGLTTWSSAPGLMVGGWAGQGWENLRLRAVQTPPAWATADSVG